MHSVGGTRPHAMSFGRRKPKRFLLNRYDRVFTHSVSADFRLSTNLVAITVDPDYFSTLYLFACFLLASSSCSVAWTVCPWAISAWCAAAFSSPDSWSLAASL